MYTDDKHYTTKAEIMETLKDDETVYSRQTVRNDIDTLAQEGYDIETVVSSGNYYYFRDREFTLDELRMIGDAVASSRFIGTGSGASSGLRGTSGERGRPDLRYGQYHK